MEIPEFAELERASELPEWRRVPIQKCIIGIAHASKCRIEGCEAPSCKKMKRVFAHTKLCRRKTTGGCPLCRQLIALCCYHAKNCIEEPEKCFVPFCLSIKRKLKQRLAAMQPITATYRNHGNALLLNIFSNINSTMLTFDQLINDKTSFAKTLEKQIYVGSDSPTDYYRLMATKKWEIEMDIEERVRTEQREMEKIIDFLGNH